MTPATETDLQRGVRLAREAGLLDERAARLALRCGLHLSTGIRQLNARGRMQTYSVTILAPQIGWNYVAQVEPASRALHDDEICYISELPQLIEQLNAWAATSPVRALNSYGQQGQEQLFFISETDRDRALQRSADGKSWIKGGVK